MKVPRLWLLSACALAALLPARAPASDLSQVVAKGNHLLVLNRLGLTPEQLAALAPLSEELAGAVRVWQANRQTVLDDASDGLVEVRATLLRGAPLSPELRKSVDDVNVELKVEDDTLYNTAVSVLKKVKDQFYPQQNAYIDWTPPRATAGAAAPGETLQQRAQREREQRAMVALAGQFLDRARYMSAIILGTDVLVQDFLRPLMDPTAPQYPQARQYLLRLVEQVRLLPEPQYQQVRNRYALDLVQVLGFASAAPQTPQPEAKPYTWGDMYDIFSDPGTPSLLRAMKQARQEAPK
jgi:hypothetical protein